MNGPLDVSEFFGIPAASAAPESVPEVSIPPQSKARNGAQSDLLAQLLSSLGKFEIPCKPEILGNFRYFSLKGVKLNRVFFFLDNFRISMLNF